MGWKCFKKCFTNNRRFALTLASLKHLFGDDDTARGASNQGRGTINASEGHDSRSSYIAEDKRGVSVVELEKRDGATLGLIISGGTDKGSRPKVSNLRPGSVAARCDALAVGDYIISVNGIRTSKLRHDEIITLLKNAGEKVTLEVEYEVPLTHTDSPPSVCSKVIQVRLDKENGSFGFVIRGGAHRDLNKSRPLVITHVRPGGPADREGTIQVGDRLLGVDGLVLTDASLPEALDAVKSVSHAILTIEYDVGVVDAVRRASGPLLVEVTRPPGTLLGLALAHSQKDPSMIVIESIKQATIAERCGALHVGDQVLAINNTRLDGLTAGEATQVLRTVDGNNIRLEIIPLSQIALRRLPDTTVTNAMPSPYLSRTPRLPRAKPFTDSQCGSSYNTLNSFRARSESLRNKVRNNQDTMNSCRFDSVSLISNWTHNSLQSCNQVCHSETIQLILHSMDNRGFGFSVSGPNCSSEIGNPPIITLIDPGGAADRCGCLQIGDRLVSVNHQRCDDMTIEEIRHTVTDSMPRISLEVEFDVVESVVPSSGIFVVKLAKRGASGLGLTITSPKNRRSGEPLIISHIRRGSTAHRIGTLSPGDRLLAIDNVRTDHWSVEDAAHCLTQVGEIVQLKIQKDDSFTEPDNSIVYTVELVRHGGPLGITISGTEEPFDPIVISGLTEGGLAEKTGALHLGDRLLAINGQSLRGKRLSEAIVLLQNSGDIVTLKISKNLAIRREVDADDYYGKFGSGIPSIDSAVESWDSYGMDQQALPGRSGTRSKTSSNVGSIKGCKIDKSGSRSESRGMAWEKESNRSSPSGSIPSSQSAVSDDDRDWSQVLEDLETVGQSELLRNVEKRILGSDELGSDEATVSTGGKQSASDSMVHNGTTSGAHQACPLLPYPRRKAQGISGDLIKDSEAQPNGIPTSLNDSLPPLPSSRPPPSPSPPFTPFPIEIHRVSLFKDRVYEDFGFSVSDALYERGIYVNRIRPGGPAEKSGILQPYDRILQVNETKTHEFDCCLTVPLIAAAGDRIDLVISRNPFPPNLKLQESSHRLPWVDDELASECPGATLQLETQYLSTPTL